MNTWHNNETMVGTSAAVDLLLLFVLIVIDRIHDLGGAFYVMSIALLFHVVFINGNKLSVVKLKKMPAPIIRYITLLGYGVVISLVGILLYSNGNYGVGGIKKHILIPVYIFALLYLLCNEAELNTFVRGMEAIGAFVSLIGLIEVVSRKPVFYVLMDDKARQLVREALVGTSRFRSYTVFCHPIISAYYLVFCFLLFFYFPLKLQTLNMACLGIITVAIMGSGSRSIWVAFFIAVILAVFDKMKDNARLNANKLIRFIATCCGVIIIILLFNSQLQSLLNAVIDRIKDTTVELYSRAGSHRVSYIIKTLEYAKTNILTSVVGRGCGFAKVYANDNPLSDGWHIIDNQYCTYLLDIGAVGVLLFLSVLLNLIRTRRDMFNSSYRFSLIMGIVSYISFVFYDGLTEWKMCNYLFGITLLLPLLSDKKHEEKFHQ